MNYREHLRALYRAVDLPESCLRELGWESLPGPNVRGAIGLGISPALGGAPPWSPEWLWTPAAPGFWADLDASDAVVRNTQPTDANWGFVGGTTTYWNPYNSAVLTGSATGGPTGGSYMRITRDGVDTPWARNNDTGILVGNKYVCSGWCRLPDGSGQGYVTLGGADDPPKFKESTWTYYERSPVPASYVYGLFGYLLTGTQSVDFASTSVENYSIASITCKGALGNLAQATAANMGYEKALGSRLSVYCAVDDGMVLGSTKSTQRAFHDGTGSTISFVYTPDELAATRTLFASADADTSAGVKCTVATNGAITYSVYNTTGGTPYLECTSAASVIVASTKALIRIVMSTAGAFVYVNGALVASDETAAGSPSAGDATNLLKIGNLAAAYTAGAVGQIADVYSVAKAVSAGEGGLLDQAFAARHGITL